MLQRCKFNYNEIFIVALKLIFDKLNFGYHYLLTLFSHSQPMLLNYFHGADRSLYIANILPNKYNKSTNTLSILAELEEPFPEGPDGKVQFSDVDYVETWKAMEQILEKGLAKNIGVSNFNSKQLARLLENCKVKPVANQVECHPYLPQVKLSEFCKSKGILITAYSPLGSPDRPWAQPGDPSLLEDPKVKGIAEKYNKTPAQVVLRYQVRTIILT